LNNSGKYVPEMDQYSILSCEYDSDFFEQIAPHFEKVGCFRITPQNRKQQKLSGAGLSWE